MTTHPSSSPTRSSSSAARVVRARTRPAPAQAEPWTAAIDLGCCRLRANRATSDPVCATASGGCMQRDLRVMRCIRPERPAPGTHPVANRSPPRTRSCPCVRPANPSARVAHEAFEVGRTQNGTGELLMGMPVAVNRDRAVVSERIGSMSLVTRATISRSAGGLRGAVRPAPDWRQRSYSLRCCDGSTRSISRCPWCAGGHGAPCGGSRRCRSARRGARRCLPTTTRGYGPREATWGRGSPIGSLPSA